ncbi:MAG: PAS domain S-box protein [Pseudomonadota bacterium]
MTELHEARARLKDSEQRLRAVLENSHDAFIAIDEAGAVVEWNRAAETLFGWSSDEALGQPMAELIVPRALRQAHREGMHRYLTTRTSRVLDKRMQLTAQHRDGREFPVEMTISRVALERGQLFTAFLHDISKRVETELQLRESESRLRSITDNAPALIAYVDRRGLVQFANRAVNDWHGGQAANVVGASVDALLGAPQREGLRGIVERALAGERCVAEMAMPHPQGGERHVEFVAVPDGGGDAATRGCHVMGLDVSDRKALARVHAEQALRDPLTGLPNRAAWSEELERALSRYQRQGTAAVMMFIDLDGFKAVNDTHGHAAGDVVLRAFAERLRGSLRASDFVARLAGDEFVVLLDAVADPENDPVPIAQKILDAASTGTVFQGQRLAIRPSIGIGVQHGAALDAESLMRCADEAMYLAKGAKSSGIHMKRCSGSSCRTFVQLAVR